MEIITAFAIGLGTLAGIVISVNTVGKLVAGWKGQQKCDECYKALNGMKEVVATMEKMAKLQTDRDGQIDLLKAEIAAVLKQYWQAISQYDTPTPDRRP